MKKNSIISVLIVSGIYILMCAASSYGYQIISESHKITGTKYAGIKELSVIEKNTLDISLPVNKCSADPQLIQLVNKAKKEIGKRMYLTLATIDVNALPWNAPVYSAYDQNYHFYWMSASNSQHSKNIRLNGKSFAVIYNSTAPEGTGFGVYLRGESRELSSNDVDTISHAIAIMGKRIHHVHFPPVSDYLSPFPRRVYEFTPHQIWVNTIETVKNKKIDKRLEITRCFFLK